MIGANATLSHVQERGTGEPVDGPIGAGDDVWAGVAPAWVGLRDEQSTGPTGRVERIPTMVVQNDEVEIPWTVGMLVTYQRDGEPSRVATVDAFETCRSRLVSDQVQTTRLTLAGITLAT